MSIATTGVDELAGAKAAGQAYFKARAAKLLDWLVAFWIFCGGFVMTEPSPYELSFLMVLVVAIFAGLGVYRSTLGLLVFFSAFVPFAILRNFVG